MRAISCCLLACIFVSLLTFSAFGITLDGDIERKEWQDATIYKLIETGAESNCDVDFAALFYIVDKRDYSIFLGVKYSAIDFDLQNINSAVEISINGSYSATFYANGDETQVDYDNFDAEGAFKFNEKHKETYCEMRIGIKYGIEDTTVVGIRVFDYKGRPSNYYEVTVCEPENITETKEHTEVQNEKETQTTVPHKSLSEHKNTTAKQYVTEPVIKAQTAVVPTSEWTTADIVKESVYSKAENFETQKTKPAEKDMENKEISTEKETTDIETEMSKETAAQSETEVSKILEEKDVKKMSDRKTWGYSIATGLLVSSVFIGVIATVIRSSDKKKNEITDVDEF